MQLMEGHKHHVQRAVLSCIEKNRGSNQSLPHAMCACVCVCMLIGTSCNAIYVARTKGTVRPSACCATPKLQSGASM